MNSDRAEAATTLKVRVKLSLCLTKYLAMKARPLLN
jgi:hypothetical protein